MKAKEKKQFITSDLSVSYLFIGSKLWLFSTEFLLFQNGQQNYMTKLNIICQICQKGIIKSPLQAICCHKIVCNDCFYAFHHLCSNKKYEYFSSDQMKKITCQSCEISPADIQCFDCKQQVFCEGCFEQIHSVGKYRYHKGKQIKNGELEKKEEVRNNFAKKKKNCSVMSERKKAKQAINEKININRVEQKYEAEKEMKKVEQKHKIAQSKMVEGQTIINEKWERLKKEINLKLSMLCEELKTKLINIEKQLTLKNINEIYEYQKANEEFYLLSIQKQNIQKLISANVQISPVFLKTKIKSLDRNIDRLVSREKSASQKGKYEIQHQVFHDLLKIISKIEFKKIIIKHSTCKQNRMKHNTQVSQIKSYNSMSFITPNTKTQEKLNFDFETNGKIKTRTKNKKLNFSYCSNYSESPVEKVTKMKTSRDIEKNVSKISCFSIMEYPIKKRNKLNQSTKNL